MADLAVQLLTLALQGVIVATFLIVALTFVTFRKMNKEVRRARMFILADRMERFLAAFTVAFLFLTAALISSAAGFPLPAPVSSIVVFVWLGGILYGAFEIFFARVRDLFRYAASVAVETPTHAPVRGEPDEAP